VAALAAPAARTACRATTLALARSSCVVVEAARLAEAKLAANRF
jgi:hypothetical protein